MLECNSGEGYLMREPVTMTLGMGSRLSSEGTMGLAWLKYSDRMGFSRKVHFILRTHTKHLVLKMVKCTVSWDFCGDPWYEKQCVCYVRVPSLTIHLSACRDGQISVVTGTLRVSTVPLAVPSANTGCV